MFKKLVTNLPFNPSLISQVSFYAQRLHREAAVRRAGFVMIALAMMLQMFAVISPPQSSVQASPNTDLINGGFNSKQEAVNHCRNNTQNYKNIMENFGISCADISDAAQVSIAPRDHDGKLYSMGRLAFGVKGETPIRVPGVGTLYVRHFWSLNKEPSYKALKLKNRQGKVFYILFNCGNLVSIGIPEPVPPEDVCPNKPKVQTNKEDCDVCDNIPGIQLEEKDCDVCPNKAGTQTNQKSCDVCPNKPGVQTKYRECDECPNIDGVQTDDKKCDVCPSIDGEQSDESQCVSCEEAQTDEDLTSCLDFSKTAKNTTQNLSDANNTVAKENDVIEYTLKTTNSGKIDIKNYVVNESIGDVLDYADVVDLHGGVKGEYGMVSWPATTIKAGETITNQVTIKVKASIPNTPASSSDPQHFDMIMTNVYGNSVQIKLPKTVTKQIELATTHSLPNTGPGTSLAVGFGLAFIIAYFFSRARLMAKELDIIKGDFSQVGGN
jgi:uncharacterized repeat protein (TIGR01451 family)